MFNAQNGEPMHITIIAVGKFKSGPYLEMYDEYAKRLSWPVTLKEIEVRGGKEQNTAVTVEREGKLILEAIADGATVIALDERGREVSSEGFADKISAWIGAGAKNLTFIIGGADGLHESVRKRANFTLSLGQMTWPHMLARVMLIEQIYRVQQILSGHPYHKKGMG